ncbi:RNA methyltransferase [Phaeovibrio sulfidiphilus]|uniref:RNA methyltransferase n=1 Tax=Phaeovibrio sulfidiphilus TaxID=1220600 RepID=A0A8J6YQ68_9PROT|nr:RNA methyltransferase [Phaeovibrio sulfidiphilus]MBE1237691.1 RNA methyltransferase [Phaeovibrio sulfidiphilus]
MISRGYFGIGIEGVSKPYNMGNVFRTAHAFGASFVFAIRTSYAREEGGKVDTSDAIASLPFYRFPEVSDLVLPKGCRVVGIELTEDAIDLPSFRHPLQAAYVLGAERVGLSEPMLERCDYVIRIPVRFSLNLGMAGALVLYDRLLTLGRFADRPVREGGPTEALKPHVHGKAAFRTTEAQRMAQFTAPAPLDEVAEARSRD